jgi:hypothetical protein
MEQWNCDLQKKMATKITIITTSCRNSETIYRTLSPKEISGLPPDEFEKVHTKASNIKFAARLIDC